MRLFFNILFDCHMSFVADLENRLWLFTSTFTLQKWIMFIFHRLDNLDFIQYVFVLFMFLILMKCRRCWSIIYAWSIALFYFLIFMSFELIDYAFVVGSCRWHSQYNLAIERMLEESTDLGHWLCDEGIVDLILEFFVFC